MTTRQTVDIEEELQKAAEEFGIATVYDHYKELVNADDVDAVCVGTWPYMHCEISIATLEAGKHILTEARMAMNLEEAREMQAAVRSDKVAMIVPAPFYLETEPRLLQMVKAGFFGDWLEVHVNALGGAYAPDAPLHWRQRKHASCRRMPPYITPSSAGLPQIAHVRNCRS